MYVCMSPGGEEWLCQEAGLPSEYAARLRAEGLSLRLLASAKLPERRDVLRPMGLLYGQIMAINRALDLWEPPSEELGYSDEEEGDEADEEDEEEGEVAESDGGDTDPTDEEEVEEEYEIVDPAAAAPVEAGPVGAAHQPPQLQAAAMLLAGARRSTLQALALYLGNALSANSVRAGCGGEEGLRASCHRLDCV